MKKTLAYATIAALFGLVLWNVFFASHGMHVDFDGDEIDGPLGALIGLVAGGAGLLVAGVALALVGVILAAVFAGLGILAVVGLAVGAVVLALVASPLLLPLAIPVAIFWFIGSRNRRKAAAAAV
jgi:hypothetical protein